MAIRKCSNWKTLPFLLMSLIVLFPLPSKAAELPATLIEEARAAVDLARKAGAEQKAADDLASARSWLSQAEKAYNDSKSLTATITARIITAKMKREKEEEIIFLATMAKLKGLTAEAKAKRDATAAELKDTQKDLADYQSALAVMKKKFEEAEKAKEIQAKAVAERKQLEEAKLHAAEMEAEKRKELEESQRKATALEEQRKRELAESQRKAAEWEEQKKRELAESQRKAAAQEEQKKRELAEAQLKDAQRAMEREKELQEAQLKEAQRAMEREKELSEAKLKADQLAAQRAREAAEMKAKEEKLLADKLADKQKFAALEAKLQALEREKSMVAEAGKIPNAAVKAGDKKIVITLLAVNLFTPANELKPEGKKTLDRVGTFLNAYPKNKVAVRGHTDSQGKAAANQALSEKRAQKVREYLVAYQNISPTLVTAEGAGPGEPVATNATEAGRSLNRRVEISVVMTE